MSVPAEEGRPSSIDAQSTPKAKVSGARNAVGIVLFLIFATVAIVEFNANRQANAGVAKLDETLKNDQDNMLSIDQVNTMINKTPDQTPVVEGTEQKATYTWKGFFKKHGIIAYYNLNKVPKLNRYEAF